MANITTLLNTIKNAVYGKDMRLALHDAIKATNDEVETQKSNTTILTGLSVVTNAAITATDTVLSGLGKLQAQITARLPFTGGTMTGNISMNANKITSSAVPSTDNDYANKKYVDDSNEDLHNVMLSKLMEATSINQVIGDSMGSDLLDSDGDAILGRVTLVDLMAQANEAIERLNTHALLDSTF